MLLDLRGRQAFSTTMPITDCSGTFSPSRCHHFVSQTWQVVKARSRPLTVIEIVMRSSEPQVGQLGVCDMTLRYCVFVALATIAPGHHFPRSVQGHERWAAGANLDPRSGGTTHPPWRVSPVATDQGVRTDRACGPALRSYGADVANDRRSVTVHPSGGVMRSAWSRQRSSRFGS